MKATTTSTLPIRWGYTQRRKTPSQATLVQIMERITGTDPTETRTDKSLEFKRCHRHLIVHSSHKMSLSHRENRLIGQLTCALALALHTV